MRIRNSLLLFLSTFFIFGICCTAIYFYSDMISESEIATYSLIVIAVLSIFFGAIFFVRLLNDLVRNAGRN